MPPLVYVVGLVAMAFTALSYMSCRARFRWRDRSMPRRRGIGESLGFLAGWAILLDYLMVPALAMSIAAAAHPRLVARSARAGARDFWPSSPRPTCWHRGRQPVQQADAVAPADRMLGLVALGALARSAWGGGAHVSTAPICQPGRGDAAFVVQRPVDRGAQLSGLRRHLDPCPKKPRAALRRWPGDLLSLCIAAGLFILQTWLASLFVLGKPASRRARPATLPFWRSPASSAARG